MSLGDASHDVCDSRFAECFLEAEDWIVPDGGPPFPEKLPASPDGSYGEAAHRDVLISEVPLSHNPALLIPQTVTPPARSRRTNQHGRIALIFLALAAILYGNTLGHRYALDDSLFITENAYTRRGVQGLADIFAH